MNWELIATVAEVVAAIGVIASLIYVARQVRSSQETAADSNRLARAGGVREVMLANATNDELRNSTMKTYGFAPYYKEMARVLDVTIDDAARTDYQNCYFFWLHWGQFASTTDPQDRQELKNIMRTYSIPAMKYSWENSPYARRALDPEFVKFVEAATAEVSDEYFANMASIGVQLDA